MEPSKDLQNHLNDENTTDTSLNAKASELDQIVIEKFHPELVQQIASCESGPAVVNTIVRLGENFDNCKQALEKLPGFQVDHVTIDDMPLVYICVDIDLTQARAIAECDKIISIEENLSTPVPQTEW